MLKDSHAFAGFSVNDIDAAKRFYGEVLGLGVEPNEMGIIDIQLGGGNHVIAYPKPNHEPATFTRSGSRLMSTPSGLGSTMSGSRNHPTRFLSLSTSREPLRLALS